jgi:hypothetical protein
MPRNWVDEVVCKHKEFESPLSFWKWAALASISAVIKDNVWINQKAFDTYPNIYVMFHADSGLKKGPPVNMAKRLVQIVGNNRVIAGRSSIQGIMKRMGTNESKPGGIINKGASAFICSSELSSAIVEDKAAMDILTDLYDRSYNSGEYESLLKMEQFDLKAPIVTMLSATNESHSADFFAQKDIGGGFFARTFVIYENEENRSNSLMGAHGESINYNELAEYLKELSQLRGPFLPFSSKEKTEYFTNKIIDEHTREISYYSDTGEIYESWYRNFKKEIKGVKDPTGTLNRFGTSVLKVSMLLSLGAQPELIITPEAMSEAILICEKLVGNIRKITVGKSGGNDATNATRKTILIKELLDRDTHSISRAQLHRKYWLQGNVNEWDETVLSFEAAGLVKIQKIGDNLIYEMPPDSVKELQEFFKGKNKS